MKEESRNPEIEPELEARIVALVLGEASDFERDQLLRLIEERPELASLKEQIQRVHQCMGVVGTGESIPDDEAWKLPADKRGVVLAVIAGDAKATPLEAESSKSVGIRTPFNAKSSWNFSNVAVTLGVAVCSAGIVLSAFLFRSTNAARRIHQVASSEPAGIDFQEDYLMDAEETNAPSSSVWMVDGVVSTDRYTKRFRSEGIDTDASKTSRPALSAIRESLDSGSTLPSPYYLTDDVQYYPAVPEFTLPLESATPSESGAKKELPQIARGEIAGAVPPLLSGAELYQVESDDLNSEGFSTSASVSSGAESISQPVTGFTINPEVQRRYELSDAKMKGFAAPSGEPLSKDKSLSNALASPNVGSRSSRAGKLFADGFQESGQGQAFGQGVPPIEGRIESDMSDEWQESSSAKMNREFDVATSEPISGAGVNGTRDGKILDRGLGGRNFGRGGFGGGGYGGADSSGFGSGGVGSGGVVTWERLGSNKNVAGADIERGNVTLDIPDPSGTVDQKLLGATSIVADGERVPQDASGERDSHWYYDARGSRQSTVSPSAPLVASVEAPAVSEALGSSVANTRQWDKQGEVVRSADGFVDIETPAADPNGFFYRLDAKFQNNAGVTEMFGESGEQTSTPTDRSSFELDAKKSLAELSDLTELPQSTPTADDDSNAQWFGKGIAAKQDVERTKSRQLGFSDALGLERWGLERAPIEKRLSGSSERAPAKKPVAPAGLDELVAQQEPFSTFSLHVSDVSFKLAQAALAQGEWPDATKIRIEEFVNAFDYGDPTPNRSEKVACRVEQSIHPFLQQRNLLRVSMKTAAEGRSNNTPLRLTLLLDNSGSMERMDRRETVRRAFTLLAQQLKPTDQVTLISFARQPRLLADKVDGSKSSELVQQIVDLPSEGGTNIEAALQLAFEKAREQQVDDAQNRIILLTDGAVNLGDANPESLSQMVTSMRDAGIAFDAAGICAEGLNDEVLEALTRQGDGRYYLLDSVESADEGFARQIAGALRPSAKNVKIQIEFNPQRVGRYKLLGFEKHRLKQEDFRNDKVDAAEMAAAEAGVAVYQFEPNPDGTGDVGTVSVRFRDLSTGQMIENRWPIPYQANAPRSEHATPSLRIATAAAMLAAKFRGEPLGDTVELDTLSELVAGLPERDRNAKRVQQLQQMIQQARQVTGK